MTSRLSKSVKHLLRYSIYYLFQYGGHRTAWICGAHFGTTHIEYFVILIIVQHLVEIAAVALIVWNILHVWLENAYFTPNMGFWEH